MVAEASVKPIRLAMIGAGIYARDAHAPALLRLRDRFEVAAVCARSLASADALAGQFGADVARTTDVTALLARDDIEAVDILLPIAIQAPVVAQALAAGKHVISEKPVAPDVAAADALIAGYAPRPGQVWMVAENWRYEEAYVRAAELVRAGAIGRVLTVHFIHYVAMRPGNKYHASTWRRAGDFPGGFLLDGGVHFVAAMRMIAGEITGVAAHTAQFTPDLPPADVMTASLQFANGALGVYLACFAAATPWDAGLTVVGERGSLRVARGRVEIADAQGKVETIPCAFYNGVEWELAAFAAAIREGAPHRNTPEEARRDVAVVEAMLGSARTERAVQVVV
jgi:predicted dehydrogenase